jgi:type I restriction enzyme S subunit
MKSGWQTSTLGDVLAVLRNGVTCKQDKSGRGDKISRIESISDASFDLGKVGYANLSESDKERYRLQPGDILFSHINSAVHVGKTAVFDSAELVYHGMNLLLMRPKDVVTSAYLEHALKFLFQSGYWRGVCKQSVNQASVNQQDISRVQISYPKSHAEQQRIVGILDEAFDNITTAKANAEKNLLNARALFESHLQSVFTQRGEGWVEKTLGDVLQKTGTVNPLQSPEAEFDYIDVSSISNATFQIEETQRLKGKDAPSRARRLVKAYDVLFATVRPTLRRIAVVPEHLDNQVCSTGYFVLRPKAEVDYRFVFYLLFTENFMGQMESLQKGASYPAVTDGEVRAQLIPFPPLPEQQRIVEQLDSLRDETQRLESIYQQKLIALEALKKSLLHQAFTGNL